MTERELIALEFLKDKMWASHFQVGRDIYARQERGGSNVGSIGAIVLGRLRKQGWVTYLPDIQLWRITKAGQAALAAKREP